MNDLERRLSEASKTESDLRHQLENAIVEARIRSDEKSEELKSIVDSKKQEIVTGLQKIKRRFFGDTNVLFALKTSLEDVTTQSCIRSMKLTSQLRSSGLQRKRIHSAVQSILSRVKGDLDVLLSASDLEVILDHLKTVAEPSQSIEAFDESIQNELKEMEVYLFWLILDAKMRREPSVEIEVPHPMSFRRNRLLRSREKRNNGRSRLETGLIEMHEVANRTTLHLDKSETEEIVEIIAVLKEYLRNGNANHSILDG